ncbi:MAG: 23S rRNA (guanosine(2251)-2'-O)-methyltransferase RlmB [Candidatus Eremiobacteraeota bacterium]|nr:23S rRNA (guanosine(2251)-2'-O)-methyltransferase RlmB [Candidatus Eremiobacteraeota bacterium]
MNEDTLNIIYGRHPVMEAIKSEVSIDKVYIYENIQKGLHHKIKKITANNKIPLVTINKMGLDRLCGQVNHQGIAAILSHREYNTIEEIFLAAEVKDEPPFILVLNEVQDPRNLGSLLRSADGAGVHGVIVGRHRSASLSPAVSRVSAGADCHMKVARVTNISDTLENLKDRGLTIVGSESDGELLYFECDYSGPIALVVGGEEKGLGQRVKKICDIRVKIPLKGEISSLNVGVAGGIVMLEISKHH